MAQRARPAAHRTNSNQAFAAVFLIALGLLFAVLYVIANNRENHSFNNGGKPPTYVEVGIGKQYEISTPGGVKELRKREIDSTALKCSYSTADDNATLPLSVAALDSDTRTTHAVATFTAPLTGLIHIECAALPSTFIDDADNAPGDIAGFFILMCTISLTFGAILAMSALYRRQQRSTRPTDEGNEPDEALGEVRPGSPGW